MKKRFLLLVLMILPLMTSAGAVKIDGIYYNLITEGNVAEVTGVRDKNIPFITIPESVTYNNVDYRVTSIGRAAFFSCSGLTSVTIPNSVTSIGEYAFRGCWGLTSIAIPNSVTSIGNGAFLSCSGLTSVTIPNSVTSIGPAAFGGCSSLTSISVEKSNPIFDSRNDCNAIIETGSNTLISGCKNTIIPNSVTSIGSDAFNACSGLTSVTIPNSVTSIGEWAFYGCSGLTSVTIPNSVTSIGSDAFNSCLGLTSVNISDIAAWCKIAFSDNPLRYAHHLCLNGEEIEDLVIPNSVTSVGDYAFDRCSGLTSVIIPNSVTSIGKEAFRGCSGLTSISVEKSNAIFDSRNDCNAIIETGSNTLISGCKNTIIPNSVTSIGDYAFYCCLGLTSVTIPNSVTSIGNYAFSGCSDLASITSQNPTPPAIRSSTFDSYTAALNVPIGSKTAYLAANYWKNFTDIKEICGTLIDGIYYYLNTEGNVAEVTGNPDKYTGSITIPESVTYNNVDYSVTSIGDYAFNLCSGLTSITIPNSVTCIGERAFYNCTGLTSVNISDIAAWCKIAFYNNPLYHANHLYLNGEEIKDLVIPNSVTSIGEGAFSHCFGLTSVTIGNSVTSIENSAFSDCIGLTSVTIPNSVTSIGEGAFRGCTGLTSVTIPNSVTSIGSSVFSICLGLTSVTIPNSVTSIGNYAFSDCIGLTSVTIPNSVTSIGEYAFFICSGLTSVTIPNSVTSIGDYAFAGCSGLTSISVEESNPIFDSRNDCNAIIETESNTLILGCKNTIIPNSVTSIGEVAFYECDYLTSITIPNSVTSIGDYAFAGCSGLTSVTIGNSVTSIGDYAFAGCSGLTSVTIGNHVTSIGNDAFYNCSGLTSVNISDIAAWCKIAFSDNPLRYAHHLYLNGEEIKDLVIPNSVTSIGNCAFRACYGLTSVTIPNSVTSIGDDAFSGCSGLTSITSLNPTPPIIGYFTFFNLYTATLNVPTGSKAAYQTAAHWSNFMNIKEIDVTEVQDIHVDNHQNAIVYDLNGRKLVAPTKGVSIINGRKVMRK